jgi:hypothetical protein
MHAEHATALQAARTLLARFRLEARKRRAGSMLLVDRPVYPRLRGTMLTTTPKRNPADGGCSPSRLGRDSRTALGSDIGRKPAGGPGRPQGPHRPHHPHPPEGRAQLTGHLRAWRALVKRPHERPIELSPGRSRARPISAAARAAALRSVSTGRCCSPPTPHREVGGGR